MNVKYWAEVNTVYGVKIKLGSNLSLSQVKSLMNQYNNINKYTGFFYGLA